MEHRSANVDSLAGMQLHSITFIYNQKLVDISGLRGMPLKSLRIHTCPLADITPLKGMELRHLELWGIKVKDISALKGMPLVSVSFRTAGK
jgi:hypothetical protein